jgi:hypothetical protein
MRCAVLGVSTKDFDHVSIPRLVVDTNVLVSAFLWQGLPGIFS